MAKLPFLVEPRKKPRMEVLGTEDSGQLEVIRRGYLTVGEKAFLQRAQQSDETTELMLAVIRQVAKENNIGIERAHKVCMAVLDDMRIDDDLFEVVAKKHRKRFDNIVNAALASATQQATMRAMCMLVFRVDPDIGAEDLQELHPDLLKALADLCTDEENKSVERLADGIEDTEAQVIDPSSYEALEKK